MGMKKSINKKYIIIGIILFFLVIGGIFVFKIVNKNEDNPNGQNTNESESKVNANIEDSSNNDESETIEPPENDENENTEDTPNTDNPNVEKPNNNSNSDINVSKDYDINMYNKVASLPVVAVGDSVMLGAVNNLQKLFVNGSFDGKVSRQIKQATSIFEDLKKQNRLGNIVVIALGSNGNCSSKCKEDLITSLENREIFWVNVTNNDKVNINDSLWSLANKYPNLHIIDWESASKNHPEYFYKKGIHLNKDGREAYAKVVFDAIYNYYVTAN